MPSVTPTGSVERIGAGDTGAPAAGHDTERIRAAAQEFEAAMINAWWSAMQDTFSQKDGDKLTGDASVLQDLSRQTMASAIAEAGGIGFANMMVRQIGEAVRGAQVSANPADL